MKINPADFFRFCSRHTALLRELVERSDAQITDGQLLALARRCASESEEQPAITVKRLKDLRIVEPESELDRGWFVIAGPVVQLVRYLLHDAKPATSQTVLGHVNSIESFCRILGKAVGNDDVTHAEMAVSDLNQTLRRIYDDIGATHESILGAVAEFKTSGRSVSVRDKFQRIVYWMEVYVIPMVEIIRVNGVMEAAFAETERLMRLASDRTVFNNVGSIDRSLRFIRLVRRYSLRVFEECRREIQPLYQALARSNNIAAGAAMALERLRRDGVDRWGAEPLIPVFTFRQYHAPSDGGIRTAFERVILSPPEIPPTIDFNEKPTRSEAMRRREWLDSLPDVASSDLPIHDLLQWLIERFPDLNTADILGGFSALFFHDDFEAHFTSESSREYETPEHVIHARPLRLKQANQ